MAWNEWELVKAEVGGQYATAMRLNGLPTDQGGGSGSGGDFVAHQDDRGA